MRSRVCALAVAVLGVTCDGDGQGAGSGARNDASSSCDGRGEALHPGFVRISSGGYIFELVDLMPEAPVLSQSRPGNVWQLRISDPGGAPVEGAALSVRTFMPDHNHSGPSAVGIEQAPGAYLVEDLLLPMPALYSITLSASLPAGEETVDYSICVSAETG